MKNNWASVIKITPRGLLMDDYWSVVSVMMSATGGSRAGSQCEDMGHFRKILVF